MPADPLCGRIATLEAECAALFAQLRTLLDAADRNTFTRLVRRHYRMLTELRVLEQERARLAGKALSTSG